MNKEKQYVTIAAMVTILVGLIIAIFLLTSQKIVVHPTIRLSNKPLK
ncbi:hypothetical protein ACG92U_00865 [Leuconostoc citreum]